MGNTCGWEGPLTDTQPELATGLTPREKKLIKDLWYNVNTKKNFRDNGSVFFIMLFKKYPYIQSYFHDFAELKPEELKVSLALRAHGIAVFTAMATYIDCLDEPHILRAMINKRTDKHHQRGITLDDMENLKEVLVDFFTLEANMKRHQQSALKAMAKLLAHHNDLYKQRLEKIADESSRKHESVTSDFESDLL